MRDLIVTIEKQDHFGRGIAHIDGKIVFVENALLNEKCKIRITKDKKKYYLGEVIERIESSFQRVSPLCPHFEVCGGCQLMMQTQESQIRLKEAKVKEILKRNAQIDEEKVLDLLTGDFFSYRNKVVFHIEKNQLGFYKENSNDLIPIQNCLLVDSSIMKIANLLKEFIQTHFTLTKAMIRLGNETNESMLCLNGVVEEKELVSFFAGKVTTLLLNGKVLLGRGTIQAKLMHFTFEVSENSFFQVNRFQTEVLYQQVIDVVKKVKPKLLLDLYCGTGTIGLIASPFAKEVIGIEVIPSAIENANRNKKINQRSNCQFYLGKVEEQLLKWDQTPDMVIVDPPRSGLDSNTRKILLNLKSPNLCYVSCDVVTLARDLKELQKVYQVLYVQPVDMFPNTYHVECVALLSLKNSVK